MLCRRSRGSSRGEEGVAEELWCSCSASSGGAQDAALGPGRRLLAAQRCAQTGPSALLRFLHVHDPPASFQHEPGYEQCRLRKSLGMLGPYKERCFQ